MVRWIRAGALASLIACGAAASPAAEVVLAPHRAAYSLSLGSAKIGSVTTIEGAMTIDWQSQCDGYTMTQRMRFRVFDSDGESVDNDVSFSSWEARDGLSYRFTLRTTRDGEVTEVLRGRATLDGAGKGGKVIFAEPQGEVLELPPTTVFPTAHTQLLIERVLAGERSLARPVFDGATLDGAMEINAVVGAAVAPGPDDGGVGIARELLAGASWRVRMAFFRTDNERGIEPEYETSMRLFANGIGGDFLFDYAEFSIRAKLERLEAMPSPRC
jgi:hypothetical protein